MKENALAALQDDFRELGARATKSLPADLVEVAREQAEEGQL